jgi:hypothetical protein
MRNFCTFARLNGYNAKASEISYEQNWLEKYLLHPYMYRVIMLDLHRLLTKTGLVVGKYSYSENKTTNFQNYTLL